MQRVLKVFALEPFELTGRLLDLFVKLSHRRGLGRLPGCLGNARAAPFGFRCYLRDLIESFRGGCGQSHVVIGVVLLLVARHSSRVPPHQGVYFDHVPACSALVASQHTGH
jgi:hypothetical protein